MKYLLTSIAFLAALCLVLLLLPLLTPRPEPVDGSLVVNQRIYQPDELEEQLQSTPYHFDSRSELIDGLINRELLLQEAKQQKIDAEVAFRRSMRDFYEQSMIKTLLDRQYSAPENQPNEAQIAACLPLLGKRFQLKRYNYPDQTTAQKIEQAQVKEYNLPYLELPEDTRAALPGLKGGEISPPLHSAAGWYRLQLTDIQPLATEQIPSVIEQEELCRRELKQQLIQNWIDLLHQKADIQRPASLKGGE